MKKRLFVKGNEAVAMAAIEAGCRYYFGYPITPQSDIPEYLSRELPRLGGEFIQAESEIASINMLLGAAATGVRAMTSSSGPGISLKQEGISYMAGSELPGVIVNISRSGPGLGGIDPSQADYFQAVKGGGHGGYHVIVLAPASVQEMYDFTIAAFNYAEEWRVPVIILADETVAHMREKLTVPPKSAVRIFNRVKPQDLKISPADFLPYDPLQGITPPMPAWGDGYHVNVVGLVHHQLLQRHAAGPSWRAGLTDRVERPRGLCEL